MTSPVRTLRTRDGTISLGGAPLLMGIVNATPDSFSDAGERRSVADRVELARALLDAGASWIDVGGESGVTNRPAVEAAEEIARVVPVIERLRHESGATVSVDTYKPAVARAAIAAGASIVNDVSGLLDPELATVCAQTGAALVVMHTRVPPKQKRFDPTLDGRVLEDVTEFVSGRMAVATARGVDVEQLIVDPGPDFGKTPAQTVEILRRLDELHVLGRPLLLAVSGKDFIGAITSRPPGQRLAGTLAAIAHGVRAGAHILRVHDVAEVAEFLTVLEVLEGTRAIEASVRLRNDLRREPRPELPGERRAARPAR